MSDKSKGNITKETISSQSKMLSQKETDRTEKTVQKNRNYSWLNPVHGNIYQLKFLMLFLYRGVTCKYSFRLGTEVKEARKFDDLVFEYTHGNKKVYRLLQVKHKIDETKKITVDKLLSEVNGDYNLVKYFKSFQACKADPFFKGGSIKDVTICTNINFEFLDLKEAGIEVCEIKEKDDILDVESKEKEPMRYRFSDSMIPKLSAKLKHSKFCQESEASDDQVKDFLQHLVFAVNQPNEEELGNIVKTELGRELDFITTENVYNKFFMRMLDWMKGRSAFITYTEGQQLIDTVKKDIFLWFNVQDPVKSFTGRSEQLETLHESLQSKKHSMICVSGLGGVGKSELVKKYIADYSQHYDNTIIWINAESYQSLSESFYELASEKIGIETKNADGEKKEIRTVVAECYQYFSNAKSLFVFDNSEIYRSDSELDSGIEPFLPSLPKNCTKPNIIITSRNQKWPKNTKVIVLDGFSENEAATFVSECLQLNSDEKEYAVELGKRLQLLPLALQQAVAYINEKNDNLSIVGSSFRISDYFNKFEEQSQESLNFEFPSDCDNTYAKTVFTTWNVTLDAIKEKKNGQDALDILNIMSYLLPDNISIDLLQIFMEDENKLATALQLLKQYSLITVQHKVFNLHRLVQQVIRMKLTSEKNEEKVLENILAKVGSKDVSVKILDHCISIWSHVYKYSEMVKTYFNFPLDVINYLIYCNRSVEADSMASEATELLSKLSQEDNDVLDALLDIRHRTALIHFKQGKIKETLNEFEELYEIRSTRYGYDAVKTLEEKFYIAKCLSRIGKKHEAVQHFREILKAQRVRCGESHLETLKAKRALANVLLELEQYNEALEHFEKVYELQKSILGENDPETLITKSNMGAVFLGQKNYEKALETFQSVLDARNSTSPEREVNFYTIGVRSNIAVALDGLGRHDESIKVYREVIQIRKRFQGENHPDTLSVQFCLALTLLQLGKCDEIVKISKEILEKQRAVLGYYSAAALKTQHLLARVLQAQNKLDEALELYLEIVRAPVKVDPSDNVALQAAVAHVFIEQGKGEKALEYLEKVYKFYETTFGVNHPETIAKQRLMGEVCHKFNKFEKALYYFTRVKSAQEVLLDKNDSDYIYICQVIDQTLYDLSAQENKKRGSTPDPFYAIQNDNFALLKKLMKNNAKVDMQDKLKRTLLHHAAELNRLEITKFLLKNGADVTRVTNTGNTALHIAVSENHLEIADQLLKNVNHDQLRSFIDAKTAKSRNTALHVAAKNVLHYMTKLLMARGATFDVKNSDGKQPVDLAKDPINISLFNKIQNLFENAQSGEIECLEDLQECPIVEYYACTNTRDSRGYNLMQVTIVHNQRELVKSLGELEILRSRDLFALPIFNVNLDDVLSLATCASTRLRDETCATKTALKHVIKLVATFRAQDKRVLDRNIIAIEDILALLKSRKEDEKLGDLARVALDSYVKMFQMSIYSVKLLDAAKRNDWTLVEKCVSELANVNVTDEGGWTPLLHAANAGNEKIVKLLLDNGAQVNCSTKMGKNTSLHIAVNKGNFDIARMLLEKYPQSDYVDAKTEAKGSTALHIATKIGSLDIVRLLFGCCAIYCLKNKDGQLPIDLASDESVKMFLKFVDELFDDAKNGNVEIIKKLKELEKDDIAAVVGACNEEELHIFQVAKVKGHKELSRQIFDLYEQAIGKEDLAN